MQSHDTTRTPLSLRDIFAVLFRYKYRIVGFFLLVMVTVTTMTLLQTRIYRSDAGLLMRAGREGIALDPSTTASNLAYVTVELKSQINSALEVIRSRDVADAVVTTLGPAAFLSPPPPPAEVEGASFGARLRYWLRGRKHELRSMAAEHVPSLAEPDLSNPGMDAENHDLAVKEFMQNLSASAVHDSNVMALAYDSPNPEIAHEVLNSVITFYLDKHIQVHQQGNSESFFDEQSQKLRVALDDTQKQLSEFKNRTGIVGLEEQRTLVLQRLDGLQQQREANASELAASRVNLRKLKANLDSVPTKIVNSVTTGLTGGASDEISKNLLELRLKEQELLSTYTEQSVPVQEIRRQIREAEGLLNTSQENRQVTEGINETHQKLLYDYLSEEGRRLSLQARDDVLGSQIKATSEELAKLNANEAEYRHLQSTLSLQEENYKRYTENLEQARIDTARKLEKITNVSVIQPATLPMEPASPKSMLNLIFGLLLGVGGGLGLAFVSNYFDRSIRTPDQVEDLLDIPVLASIPKEERGKGKAATWPLALGESLHQISLPETLMLPGPMQPLPPGQEFDEDLDQDDQDVLPAQLRPKTVRSYPGKAICLTSCYPGEGVSTIACKLARNLARNTGEPILLVDACFQRPTIHTILKVPAAPGLRDIHKLPDDLDQVIQKVPGEPMLDVICVGNGANNGHTALAHATFADMLEVLRQHYRVVVFDTPAVSESSLSGKLGNGVDGVILVIAAEEVREVVAQKATKLLNRSGAKVLGAILNKRKFYIPDWLYQKL